MGTKIVAVLSIALLLFALTPLPVWAAAEIIETWPTEDKVVALTFNAGSDAGSVGRIMDILDDRGEAATFFLTGRWIENNAEEARIIAGADHTVGNLGYSDRDMTSMSAEEVREELGRTENLARDTFGTGLRPFFRPPGGAYDETLLDILGEEDYEYATMWTVDTLDWDAAPAQTIFERVQNNLRPGAIILMHLGSDTETAEALPSILDHLDEQGYRAVTMEEMTDRESEGRVYRVQPGDTLSSISIETGISVEEIAETNDLSDPYVIQVGQVLVIPGPDRPEEPEEDREPEEESEPEPDPEPEESPEHESDTPSEESDRDDPSEGEPSGEQEPEGSASWWNFPLRILGLLWRGFWELASDGVQFLVDYLRH
ncbi:MAG: polysaccharide deacetylase family protein [Clostridia bacterium]